jgi:lipoprotein-releasing system permease protein
LNYKTNQISAIELKLAADVDENEVIQLLQNKLGDSYKIETREQLNAVFHKMLNTENLVSYLVFTLILIIALFNVIGAIVMMILDKKDNLKTLFSLGATIREIKRIFILQGFLLTFFGLLIGLFLSITFVILQKKLGFIMITTELAYPVEFRIINVIIVFITILILGFLAARIASSRISNKILR